MGYLTSKRMLRKGCLKAFKKNVEMLVVDGVWNVDCWRGLENTRDARDGGGSGLSTCGQKRMQLK